jgi:SAM-dependent methyltransferase
MSDLTARPPTIEPEDEQGRANDALWAKSNLVKPYANRTLRPVEVMVLVRHREALSGRVLELGCGAGRLTGYLSEIATYTLGLDISPAMVAYCRKTYPRATFEEGDLRGVTTMKPGSYDVIVAAFNVLDVLNDADRSEVLDGIHYALAPGGLVIMSTHNRASMLRGVRAELARRSRIGLALTIANVPRWLLNRRRLLRFERHEPGYAILNDVSYQFAALHYYISRGAQERQFADHGFELLECLDLDGQRVEAGEEARHCSELHYVARASADVGPSAWRRDFTGLPQYVSMNRSTCARPVSQS